MRAPRAVLVYLSLFWLGLMRRRCAHLLHARYLLTPDSMEFWQNGAARLHDRLVYNKVAAGAAAGTGAAQEGAAASAGPETEWEVSRLAP